MLTLCLDIGGTKIAAGLADPAGTLVHTAQRPTPAYGGAEQVWAAVAEMIADALGVAGGAVGGVGIASAGPIDLHSGRVSPINIGSWGGFPLRDRVAAAVPGVPVRLGGDGVCMALGEHWLGAGRGARFLLGLVVSTGVGGGLVLDGAPCLGRTGNAGHVGHVVVDPDGSPCPCGGRGCVETIASGPSLARWAAPTKSRLRRRSDWIPGLTAPIRSSVIQHWGPYRAAPPPPPPAAAVSSTT